MEKTWMIELRTAQGNQLGARDKVKGSEEEALKTAKWWLRECLSTGGAEVLVIEDLGDGNLGECIYQGDFDLPATIERERADLADLERELSIGYSPDELDSAMGCKYPGIGRSHHPECLCPTCFPEYPEDYQDL